MKSWLQVLNAIDVIGSETTSKTVAEWVGVSDTHAQQVLKRLHKWGHVTRTTSPRVQARGRRPYLYTLTIKGIERLERAEWELGDRWWNYPDTRPKSHRRPGEPPYGSPEWEQWQRKMDIQNHPIRMELQKRMSDIMAGDKPAPGELALMKQLMNSIDTRPLWFVRDHGSE